jgi:CheY-like chemotaxis protein/curved DNA-binding protein CbpA
LAAIQWGGGAEVEVSRILLVEDDRAIQKLIQDALLTDGYEVVCERDGRGAVKIFESSPIDAVVLDLLLPGMNGFQVAEKIRSLSAGASVPMVMLSGIYRGVRHRNDAIAKFNILAYVDKPFRMEQILMPLRSVLGTVRAAGSVPGEAPVAPVPEAPPPAAIALEAPPAPAPQRPIVEPVIPEAFRASAPAGPRPIVQAVAPAPKPQPEPREPAPQPSEPPSITLRGDLRERALPWVLGELFRRRATGSLLLQNGSVRKIVYLREGAPVSVRSNILQECLGIVLVREKLISQADCDESIRRMRGSNRLQGHVLIEMGVMSAQNLRFALQRQLQIKLFDVFRWDRGEFLFRERDELPRGLASMEMPPAQLLYEGIREMPAPLLGRELASRLDERPVAAQSDLLFQFPEQERQYLATLDGRLTIREIVALRPIEDIASLLLAAMCLGSVLPAMSILVPVGAPELGSEARPISPPAQATPAAPARPISAVSPPTPEAPPAPAARPISAVSPSSMPPPPVSKPAPPRPPPAAAAPVKSAAELEFTLANLEGKDHFNVLGLERGASAAEVRAAFHKLAKEYHPDRFAMSTGQSREMADKIFARIAAAHRVLSDEKDRRAYEAELESGGASSAAAETVAKVVAAENAFSQGDACLRRRAYADAVTKFKEAIDLYGEEGEYHAYLAYAMLMTNPGDAALQRSAEQSLRRAKELDPRSDKAFLFHGYLYKNAGMMAQAKAEFERAAEMNPQNVEAARELRLISMRQGRGG